MRLACQDCVPWIGADGRVTHATTCAVAHELDRTYWTDRAWFDRHPDRNARRRRPTWAERQSIASQLGRNVLRETVHVVRVSGCAHYVRIGEVVMGVADYCDAEIPAAFETARP